MWDCSNQIPICFNRTTLQCRCYLGGNVEYSQESNCCPRLNAKCSIDGRCKKANTLANFIVTTLRPNYTYQVSNKSRQLKSWQAQWRYYMSIELHKSTEVVSPLLKRRGHALRKCTFNNVIICGKVSSEPCIPIPNWIPYKISKRYPKVVI
jgi:hypothetical protein